MLTRRTWSGSCSDLGVLTGEPRLVLSAGDDLLSRAAGAPPAGRAPPPGGLSGPCRGLICGPQPGGRGWPAVASGLVALAGGRGARPGPVAHPLTPLADLALVPGAWFPGAADLRAAAAGL